MESPRDFEHVTGFAAAEGDALLCFFLPDQADAAVGAVHGFDEAGLDMFVHGAAGCSVRSWSMC